MYMGDLSVMKKGGGIGSGIGVRSKIRGRGNKDRS